MSSLICPISNEKTDSNVSRLTILLNSVLVIVFIITWQPIPLYISAADYFIRAFLDGNYSPIRMIAFGLVKALGWTPKMIDKAPKIFASRLGFLCLLASYILINLDLPTASISISIMATSLFLLDAVGNYCVGCLIYHHLVFPFYSKKYYYYIYLNQFKLTLQKARIFLNRFAYNSTDSYETRFNKVFILIIALSCSLCGAIWSLMYYFYFGFGLTMVLPFLFTILVGSVIPISHLLKNYIPLIYAQLISITWITAFIQWSIGSLHDSGVVVLWSFLGPIGALLFLSIKETVFWFFNFVVIIIITVFIEPKLSNDSIYITDQIRNVFYLMNFLMALGVVFAAYAWFAKSLQKEKKRSEDLLLNILPEETANELKIKGESIPKYYNSVSILFTDFKGFTKVASETSPQELIIALNECFTAFDDIIEKHHLEKIKTIGDAYMCAGGIPKSNLTNALDAVSAALEMNKWVSKWNLDRVEKGLTAWEIRIGIHTGEIIAGVIGKKKFVYDVWGDAVNVASRMESNGEAGKINISSTTFELIKEHFNCIYRGEIEAKNRGKIGMYFVDSIK